MEFHNEAIVFHQFSMNMTFDLANDEPLEGNTYFKMGGRMGWNEWFLGSLDIPLDLSSVNSQANDFYVNLGILSGINGEIATDQFINMLMNLHILSMMIFPTMLQMFFKILWKFINIKLDQLIGLVGR